MLDTTFVPPMPVVMSNTVTGGDIAVVLMTVQPPSSSSLYRRNTTNTTTTTHLTLNSRATFDALPVAQPGQTIGVYVRPTPR